MPNWACGYVAITGTKQNIINFVSRFIHDDFDETENDIRYFARSFTNTTKASVLDDIDSVFTDKVSEAEETFALDVSFAWSAYSCLIEGYPQKNSSSCITLSEACVSDQISVVIRTEEGGMGFEEHITCDKAGVVIDICSDLLPHVCPACGCQHYIASFGDIDEYECYSCGEVGLQPVLDIEIEVVPE